MVTSKRRAERAEKKKTNAAWSNKAEKKVEKLKKKEKKDKKKTWLKAQAGGGIESKGLKRARSMLGIPNEKEEDEDEWQELAREERMAKKVKRGELRQDVFDQEFGHI